MKAEAQALHDRIIREVKLPKGWVCEKGWPWEEDTHIVAPERVAGVIVKTKDRHLKIQLPGHGPGAAYVDILDGESSEFKGRGWRDRMIEGVWRAIWFLEKWIEDRGDAAWGRAWQTMAWQELSRKPKTVWERL